MTAIGVKECEGGLGRFYISLCERAINYPFTPLHLSWQNRHALCSPPGGGSPRIGLLRCATQPAPNWFLIPLDASECQAPKGSDCARSEEAKPTTRIASGSRGAGASCWIALWDHTADGRDSVSGHFTVRGSQQLMRKEMAMSEPTDR